jgi:hypothetical protein
LKLLVFALTAASAARTSTRKVDPDLRQAQPPSREVRASDDSGNWIRRAKDYASRVKGAQIQIRFGSSDPE